MGGFEQWCREVTTRLRDRKHVVRVLTSCYGVTDGPLPEKHVTRTLHLQANVHNYWPWSFFLKRPYQNRHNKHQLRSVINGFDPDLVVVWGMWNLSRYLPYWAERWMLDRVAYYIASYWPRNKDIHRQYWEKQPNRLATKLVKTPFRVLALAHLRREGYPPHLRFDHARCCSQFVRDELVEAGPLRSSAKVLYGGIDPKPFLSNARPVDESIDTLSLLYFGSLVPHKGVHTAIEALGFLKQQGLGKHVNLTILGGGHPDYEAQLHKLTRKLGLAEEIHFAGRVPRSEVPSWLGHFDVFLFTSTWAEPFGRTIVEAMAAGLPVIGSDVGGSREIFEYYSEDLLFEPEDSRGLADRILRLVEDKALRQHLAREGQRIVLERFTLERMVDDIEIWFRDILI
jgi:glycosyltransferase involved in cell wall biosynthesis